MTTREESPGLTDDNVGAPGTPSTVTAGALVKADVVPEAFADTPQVKEVPAGRFANCHDLAVEPTSLCTFAAALAEVHLTMNPAAAAVVDQ